MSTRRAFKRGQAWMSPKGTFYIVEDQTADDQVALRSGLQGTGRRIFKPLSAPKTWLCVSDQVDAQVRQDAMEGKLDTLFAAHKVLLTLTPVQRKVMCWIGKKWRAEPKYGELWTINGDPICNTATFESLAAKSLCAKNEYGCWEATDWGREFTQLMDL